MSVAPLSLASTLPHQEHQPRVSWSDLDDPIESISAAAHVSASSGPTVPEVPQDLSGVSTRELRVLSNQLYRLLDTDFPPFGIRDDFDAVAVALEERQASAAERSESTKLREKFRDNPVSSRFELFHDGIMVGYVKYDMRAGRIRLLETVVGPAYRRAGLEPVLVKEALLSAHRRRLAAVPYCPHAQAFLAENPQFRALIPIG